MAWQPAWQLLVAFNNQAQDNPASITSVAAPPGTLGATNVWTDITADVRTNVDTNRGKQHELDHTQTGTLSLTLDNRAGNYDPWATSGPYAGLVLPGKPVRLQATTGGVTYPVYTGITDVWATQWTGEYYGTVALSCVDLFGYLQNEYINNPAYYTGLVSGAGATHLWRFADAAGSPSIADSIGASPADPRKTAWSSTTGPLVTDMLPAANLAPNSNVPSAFFVVPPIPPSVNLTVEVWTLHAQAPAARSYLWQQGYNGSGLLPGIALWVDTGGHPGFTDNGGATHAAAISIADGLWHHLALNFVDSTATFTLYVDGVSAVTFAWISRVFVDTYGIVGSGDWPNIDNPACYGSIANLAFYWPTALTPTQIVTHYTAGVFPVETSGARVSRVASLMAIPGGTVDTGNSQMQALTAQGEQTLSYLQTIETSERGLMFIATDGRLNFRSRGTVYGTTTSTVTFTDAPAGIPFELSPQIAIDTQDVYEQIQLQRNNGVAQTAGTTNGPFGARTYQQSGLLNNTDLEVAGMAAWLAAQFATPVPRIRQIVVRPVSTAATGTTMVALLGLEIGAVVTVTRTSTRRTAFSYVCNVEGINIHIYPETGDWNAELQLTPLAPYVPWILGVSLLGSNTYLFF